MHSAVLQSQLLEAKRNDRRTAKPAVFMNCSTMPVFCLRRQASQICVHLDFPQGSYMPNRVQALLNSFQCGEVAPKRYDRYCWFSQNETRIRRGEMAHAKLQILLVCEIEELAVLLMYNPRHEIVSALVLVRVIRHEEGCHATCEGRCHNYRDLVAISQPLSQAGRDV